MIRWVRSSLLLLLVLLTVACTVSGIGSSSSPTPRTLSRVSELAPAAPPTPSPAPSPTRASAPVEVSGGATPIVLTPTPVAVGIRILEPQEAARVPAGLVRVRVEVIGVNLRTPGGLAGRHDGHLAVFLDRQEVLDTAESTFVLRIDRPGQHNIQVVLHRDDHSEWEGPVVASVNVLVEPAP